MGTGSDKIWAFRVSSGLFFFFFLFLFFGGGGYVLQGNSYCKVMYKLLYCYVYLGVGIFIKLSFGCNFNMG